MRFLRKTLVLGVCCLLLGGATAIVFSPRTSEAAETAAELAASVENYKTSAEPFLKKYCWDCHADGANEGMRAFDSHPSTHELIADQGLWWAVLKNVRTGVMPPADYPRPTPEEIAGLATWIKQGAFGLDPDAPDPGRTTIRRLNREEYRNTVRDLMGVDYDTLVEFPPDDSGSGFDNVSDALSISPLLMEKYVTAAESIVNQSVPRISREMPVAEFNGDSIRSEDGQHKGNELDYYVSTSIQRKFRAPHTSEYRLVVEGSVNGGFDFDPGQCRITCFVDEQELWSKEFAWQTGQSQQFPTNIKLDSGEHTLRFEVTSLTDAAERKGGIRFRIRRVRLEGPLDREHWNSPRGYDRHFTRREPPPAEDEAGRTAYAEELIQRFGTRAFRRPVDRPFLDRLVAYSRQIDHAPDRSFEDSIAQTMIVMLSSPRFLFRFEEIESGHSDDRFPDVDDYTLASRLSYFLWSTMPDQQLFELAERGELRSHYDEQITRMLADEKAGRLIRNFVGQWLQARDVEGVSIDPIAAVGAQKEFEVLRNQFFRGRGRNRDDGERQSEEEAAKARNRMQELRELRDGFNAELRTAMRRETEMFVSHVLKQDLSLLDLIDCNYTFLNERLAKHYNIPGVSGNDMRLVTLPADSPRGGLLTQGTFLVVTSNPTRTSPVKRGLFILDNLLGTPAPPPPPDVPELEKSQETTEGHEPTLREALELHRSQALCRSCHARFDPLGLGLENFNALGMWRDTDAGQPIDSAGQLITGEEFQTVSELKAILRETRRTDFYRCVAERMLTYALGRGLTAQDEESLDQIVTQLDAGGGRSSVLIYAIVNSAPFTKVRPRGVDADTIKSTDAKPAESAPAEFSQSSPSE